MHRVALHGYYGNGNMGDDAILYAAMSVLRSLPDTEITVIGHPIPFMNTRLGMRIAKLPFGRTLLYRLHVQQMLRRAYETDVLILGGGGILCDRESRDVANDILLIQKMQLKQKPTMIYAIGVPSLWREKSKEMIKQVVEKAKYCSCRDPASAMKIEDLGVKATVHVTGDPALRIPSILGFNPIPKELDLQEANICVSLRVSTINKPMARAISKLVDFLSSYGARIHFIPMRTTWHSDDRFAHDVICRILNGHPNIVLHNERPSVDGFYRQLMDMTLTIGMPLHSIIASASMGVPCIALAYTPDIINFMEYIQAEEYVISLADACNSDQLIERCEKLFSSYTATSKKLLQNVKEIEKKSFLDEEAMRKICRFG